MKTVFIGREEERRRIKQSDSYIKGVVNPSPCTIGWHCPMLNMPIRFMGVRSDDEDPNKKAWPSGQAARLPT